MPDIFLGLWTLVVADQVSAAFRIEVLSAVPGMSQRAVARLAKKLDEAEESNSSVEIGEEMRHLTLQVGVVAPAPVPLGPAAQ